MPNCSINAIRDKGDSEDHFVKDCPLSQPDNKAQKCHYMDHRNANNTDSTTAKVMEPLTRLFMNLVAQLELLTPSGHGSHGRIPTHDGKGWNCQQWMGFHNGHRWHTNDSYHKREEPSQDHHIDCHHKAPFRHNGHKWGSRDGTGNKGNFSRGCHTRSMKLGLVVNATQNAQSCPILRSTKRRLHLCQPH